MGQGQIHHGEDPFATPKEDREPVRRFRGRLAAGVTIWTAGSDKTSEGLTVSSLMVAEGSPSRILGLINDTTDLFERVGETGRFIVHVVPASHKRLADRFAGLYPSPGGLFSGLTVVETEWGPALDVPNRAYCKLVAREQQGYHSLVVGEIDQLDLEDPADPLIHYRGRYLSS